MSGGTVVVSLRVAALHAGLRRQEREGPASEQGLTCLGFLDEAQLHPLR